MNANLPTKIAAWCFLAAAALLWGGWMLLPVHIGTFFEVSDFARVNEVFHFWIWTYRFYIFGMVFTVIAFVALASLLSESEARVLIWPGAAVITAGMIVSALGAAFYYHHGAWGAQDTAGLSEVEIQAFVNDLRVDTEYVTCLVRFGRVFSGLGLLLVGCGLIQWKLLPAWLGWGAVAIGLAAMGLTMLLPDRLELYQPVFHIQCLWLLAAGIVLLRGHGERGALAP